MIRTQISLEKREYERAKREARALGNARGQPDLRSLFFSTRHLFERYTIRKQ